MCVRLLIALHCHTHIITATSGSGLAAAELKSTDKGNQYLQGLSNLAAEFVSRFGPLQRYSPSHSPYFMQKNWLQRLMSAMSGLYSSTAASRFR